MGNQIFTNDASSILAGSINAVATVVQASTGEGALFPSPTGSQYFMIAVEDTSGNIEIMKCTSRTGDNLTVVRGQESTTARSFTANQARIELRDTAGTLANLVQKSGDTLTGNLDLGTHTVSNGTLSGNTITGGQIYATPLRGAIGDSSNEIDVPGDGTRATAGGLRILCSGDVLPVYTVGMIIAWYGALVNRPAGWNPCDGNTYNTHATPDLRDRFIIGAGGSVSPSLGDLSTRNYTAASASAGTPTIDPVTLITANLPAHHHSSTIYVGNTGQVVGPLGTGSGSNFFFGGVGAGTRKDWDTNDVGSGTPFTPTAPAMAGHTHNVAGDKAFGLFYIMFTG